MLSHIAVILRTYGQLSTTE